MFLILASALVGGPITTALLWNHGAIEALLAAPFGGSFAALCAATLIGARHTVAEARARRRNAPVHAHFSPMWTAAAHG